MNLRKKKKLAKRMLKVGEDRIVFLESRLDEIKDAITKQDILDLKKSGAIIVKEKKGRRTKQGKHNRNRSVGNTRKKIKQRKRTYMKMTRKMRSYIKSEKLEGEAKKDLSKKIKNREFRTREHMREYLGGKKA